MRRPQCLSSQVLITPRFPLKRNETVWLRTIYVHVIPTSEQYKRVVIAVTGFNRLIDTSTGQGKTSGLFSDESRFALSYNDGRIRVYRRMCERYDDCCILQRDRFGGGGSVMGIVPN